MISRRTTLVGVGGLALAGVGATLVGFRGIGSMEEYHASVAAMRAQLNAAPHARDFIRYATLAANSHNSQPWLFEILDNRIDILPDITRRLRAVDADDHHLFASLGCAAENLAIAAAMRAMPGVISFVPEDGGAVRFEWGGDAAAEPSLFAAIPRRQSTRGDYNGKPISSADLAPLRAAATAVGGVDLILITDRAQINKVRDLVVAANSVQVADAAFIGELKDWLRFNPAHALKRGDGLFSAASGNPTLPSWLGPTMFDFAFTADAENDKYVQQIATSSGLAVFVAHGEGPAHWVQAGRACQRFALAATALGLKHAFLNQPVEVARFRPDLASLVGTPGSRPDIVMRFGYGAALPYSARRPVSALLV